MKKIGVCYTTIYDSNKFLKSLVDNFSKFAHCDEVSIVCVADYKTPNQKRGEAYCQKHNVDFHVYSIREQKEWLKQFPKLKKELQYNSNNIRNLGYLWLAQQDCDIIISLDDDNFPIPEDDFIKQHGIVDSEVALPLLKSSNGWFNPCNLLETTRPVYHRGYPISKRNNTNYSALPKMGKIALNMGLWLGVPDTYTMSLIETPNLTSYKYTSRNQLMIGKDVMLTICSQNTAFSRAMLPCYYYVREGNGVLRLDDIWQGFFAKKCIDAVGEYVAVGHPLTFHKRHSHNFLKDLEGETKGIVMNEHLVEWLEGVELESKTYVDAYLELALALELAFKFGWSAKERKFWLDTVRRMRVWVETCEAIM